MSSHGPRRAGAPGAHGALCAGRGRRGGSRGRGGADTGPPGTTRGAAGGGGGRRGSRVRLTAPPASTARGPRTSPDRRPRSVPARRHGCRPRPPPPFSGLGSPHPSRWHRPSPAPPPVPHPSPSCSGNQRCPGRAILSPGKTTSCFRPLRWAGLPLRRADGAGSGASRAPPCGGRSGRGGEAASGPPSRAPAGGGPAPPPERSSPGQDSGFVRTRDSGGGRGPWGAAPMRSFLSRGQSIGLRTEASQVRF